MLKIRCKVCNSELYTGCSKKFCGCSNMMSLQDDKISAIDLTKVVIVEGAVNKKSSNVLSYEDIAWQEERKKRKIRRLDFEVR